MEKAEPQLLCLRWNNHQSNLVSVFDQLLQNEAFCDVTLAVDGRTIKCHQMVLAASSPYFQGIFMENTCKHPIVFLKDMKYNQIRSLVEYIYYGEAAVPEDQLQGLLKIAESLKIKGLVEIEENGSLPGKEADKSPEKKLVPRKDLHSPGYRTPPNIVVNHEGRIQTPGGKEDDAGELIIDEEDSMHSEGSAPLASSGQAVTPIEVSPEYPGYNSDETPPAPGMIRVVGANGKAEWKRYKQYTKDDILAAIEEVKAGASALQASRKYGVPSRTLYDKVKKMGILTANMQKQIQQKKPPVPIQPNSDSRSETITPPNTSAPQINFLGLQVPQANLPVVNGIHHNGNGLSSTTFTNGATISATANPFLPGVTAGVAGVPPISSSLMMSVMSMMSEKLKAGGLMNKNVNENLTNLLKKSSSGSEGSDSGHSSGEPENGDVVIIKEEKRTDDIAVDKEKLSSQQQTAQQLISHLVNLNSLAAINTKTPVTLTPRAGGESSSQPEAVSPTSIGRASSVITATGSALKRKRASESSDQSSDSQKEMNEVKKLLVEPVKQEAA